MFGLLITCYLFLGGAGGGVLMVLGALECARLWPRARFGRALALPDDFFARAWPLGFVVLATGALCLLADLGRPDRLLNLVISPAPSAITVGAFALAAALAVAAVFALAALLDGPRIPRVAAAALAIAGIAAGATVMVYTGVLLQGLASVLFWQTPLLPLLFALSSASCGIGCALFAAAFVEARHPFVRPLVWLARIDGVLIVAEAVCLVVYLAWAFASPGTTPAAAAIAQGDLAWLFWGGVGVCGLAVPFVMERLITYGNSRTQLLWIAALLLAGGFALRCVFVGASAYDPTQMAGPLLGLAV